MLFMVMSTPRPEQPSTMRAAQSRFWDWMASMQQDGTARAVYVKAGRGAMVVFDVPDHIALHRVMTQWAEHVPAEFTVWPLVEPGIQEAIARKG